MVRTLFTLGLLAATATAQQTAAATRMITFSGFTWAVKSSTGQVGPGPNYFSDSSNNVWVDSTGRMHLKITHSGGKWYCAEVILQGTLGYGTYRFYLDSPVDNLDPNVVLGLFTWNDDPSYNHREIDIEFARWGNAKNANGWYTVQPPSSATQASFLEPPNVPQSTNMFNWQNLSGSLSVAYQSLQGFATAPGPSNPPIANFTVTSGVPPTGGENVHINLWLYQGRPPANRNTVELIVNRFEFAPQ